MIERLLRRPSLIERGFSRRGPWITQFTVDGRTYGGATNVDDSRVRQFEERFGSARSVLDLGCLEGAQTFLLGRVPGRTIVGVEGRTDNIERARYVQTLLRARNVRLVQANLETSDLGSFGRFDAVFCSGLLYHLPRPWELIDSFRSATDRVFLSTHYAPADRADQVVEGIPGASYREFGLGDALSGLSPESYWMTLDAITTRLRRNGFDTVDVLLNEDHPHGPIVNLAAESSGADSPPDPIA